MRLNFDQTRLVRIWQWGAIALLALLCLSALYTVLYFVSRFRALPDPDELYEAEALIRSQAEPGDRLAANPRWAYPLLLSGVRHDKGGRFDWIEGVEDANWDCEIQTDLRRVWVVSLFNKGAPRELEKQGYASFFSRTLKKTEVFGFHRTRPVNVLSLMDELPRLRVWSEDASGKTHPAAFSEGKHQFEGNTSWSAVRVSVENVGGQVHRCIWTHPQKDRIVKIQTDMPPWAKRFHLDGGLTLSAMWRKEPGKLVMTASNGGQSIAEMTFQHRSRWEHAVGDIPEPGSPVTVSIRATDVGGMHFCWRAFVLGDE